MLDLLHKIYVKNYMDATDERDSTFALLGLATDSDTLDLRANYNLDLVLIQVARALITKAGRLELLSWSQFPKKLPESGTILPTWVSDWRSSLAPSYNPLVIERAGCTAKEVGDEWEARQSCTGGVSTGTCLNMKTG